MSGLGLKYRADRAVQWNSTYNKADARMLCRHWSDICVCEITVYVERMNLKSDCNACYFLSETIRFIDLSIQSAHHVEIINDEGLWRGGQISYTAGSVECWRCVWAVFISDERTNESKDDRHFDGGHHALARSTPNEAPGIRLLWRSTMYSVLSVA